MSQDKYGRLKKKLKELRDERRGLNAELKQLRAAKTALETKITKLTYEIRDTMDLIPQQKLNNLKLGLRQREKALKEAIDHPILKNHLPHYESRVIEIKAEIEKAQYEVNSERALEVIFEP